MRIDSSEKILETPILEIRKLLRKRRDYEWSTGFAANLLKISQDNALNLVEELVRRGFIEFVRMVDEEQYWRNTMEGNTLALASAAKQITRKTADRIFSEFMERVERVNTDPYFLYEVRKVVVFGSYLADTPRISDIDLAVELVPKEDNVHRRGELFEERIRKAREEGKRFRNITEEVCWPELEVRKFLKSRSRVISLHSTGDGVLKIADYKVVYSEDYQESSL